MKKVIIESPLKGDTELNKRYAKACILDSLKRGEAPFASHLLYDQAGILDDSVPAERELGIQAGFVWGTMADLSAFYVDYGMSSGMIRGLENALKENIPVEIRRLGPEWT